MKGNEKVENGTVKKGEATVFIFRLSWSINETILADKGIR